MRLAPPGVAVDVRDGLGVVDVLGTDPASVLHVSGDPIWPHAYDNHGSVGELAARVGGGAPRPEGLDLLRDYLADPGLRIDASSGRVGGLRVEPLRPLLRLLLQRGRHLASMRTISCRLDIHHRDGRDWVSWYLGYGPEEALPDTCSTGTTRSADTCRPESGP